MCTIDEFVTSMKAVPYKEDLPFAAASGAAIDEECVIVLHVDQKAYELEGGSCTGLRFSSIQEALNRAKELSTEQKNVQILIAPGIYHESLSIKNLNETCGSITLQAAAFGHVIISGSEPFIDDWCSFPHTTVFVHEWPYNLGLSPNLWISYGIHFHETMRRKEMVFADGRLLKQVLSHELLEANTFYVSDMEKKIFLMLPEGVTPREAGVVTATRGPLFHAENVQHLILRGLCFMHGISKVADGAVMFEDAEHLLIEDCRMEWNSWEGLCFKNCSHVTVRNTASNHNGGAGIVISKGRNILFEDNETSSNNWRGAAAGYTQWSTAGVKALMIHRGIFRRHISRYNETLGFWMDWDNREVLLDELLIEGNVNDGMMIEANEGPIVLRNTISRRNRVGIYIASTCNLSLYRNAFYGNFESQMAVFGDWGEGRKPKDWETGAAYNTHPEHTRMEHCLLAAVYPEQQIFQQRYDDCQRGWNTFLGTLHAEKNTYYHPISQQVFCGEDAVCISFDQWKRITDKNSSWVDFSLSKENRSTARIQLPDNKGIFAFGKEILVQIEPDPLGIKAGKIDKVIFYDKNFQRIGSTVRAPFCFQWRDGLPGVHEIWVMIQDSGGQVYRTRTVRLVIVPMEKRGALLREYWFDVQGSQAIDLASHTLGFANKPAGSDFIPQLWISQDWGSQYGQRIRGYLHPPADDAYRFLVQGDGDTLLYLSSCDSPLYKRVISLHDSEPVYLKAGRKYYMEILQKVVKSNEPLQVFWAGDEMPMQIVQGEHLSTYIE